MDVRMVTQTRDISLSAVSVHDTASALHLSHGINSLIYQMEGHRMKAFLLGGPWHDSDAG